MTDLNALIVFANVAQAGSFSAASRRLDMPVSTVSRQVARLEDTLGIRLIERSTRSFRLTELGGRILEQARRALAVSDAVDRLAAEQATGVTGLLRLLVPPALAEPLLAPAVVAFTAAHPQVRLQVSVGSRPSDDPIEEADLTLRLGAMQDSALIALRVLRYRDRLVASPGYLAHHEAPAQPADLARHRLLTTLDRAPGHRWAFRRAKDRARETADLQSHLATDDIAGLVAAVLADGGVGALPPVTRPELLCDGRLVEVMPDWQLEPRDLFLVHLGRRHVPRPVDLFKEIAAQMIPALFPGLSE